MCKLSEEHAQELRETRPEAPMVPLRFYTTLLIRVAVLRDENKLLRRELAALKEETKQ